MKRLWEELKVGLVGCLGLLIAFLILLTLCCLAGFIAMSIAKIFIISETIIILAGAIGYIAMIVVIFVLQHIAFKKHKQKNSQKDTRK